MRDVRDELQDEVVTQYINLKSKRGTIVLPTGFGKSYVAMKLIKKLNPSKVIILVNSQILRDDNWREEFRSFGMEEYYNKFVEMRTYQYIYNKAPEDLKGFDKDSLVVLDEVDFISNTEKLGASLDLFLGYRILGLTGFVTSSKRMWFKKNLPILRTVTIEEAEEAGLLNRLKLYIVRSPMSSEESSSYQSLLNSLNKNNAQLGSLNLALFDGSISEDEFNVLSTRLKFNSERVIRLRAAFLYKLKSNVTMSKKLLHYFHDKDSNTKSVVFSKLTEQSAKISKNVYNGTLSTKENRKIFNSFNSSEIKNLGVVAKLNRGVNIKRLNVGIWEAYTSSDTQFAQTSGRFRRLKPDEVATIVIIIPYYKNALGKFTPTQGINWATKMIKSVKIQETKVWDFCK